MLSNDTEFKVTQFADDTIIFLDGSKDTLNSTLDELERFCKHDQALKSILIKHNLFG